jgi:hypothetical protein
MRRGTKRRNPVRRRICAQPDIAPAIEPIDATNARILPNRKGLFMKTSAESRWFWRADPAAALGQWFIDSGIHDIEAAGGDIRTDAYLADANQAELGIKRRGTGRGIEIKGLVSLLGTGCDVAPFQGPIELWTKWFCDTLRLDGAPLILVRKRRWLRQFDTSGAAPRQIALNSDELKQGCTVEYTELSGDGIAPWVTLGFEAFGPMEGLAGSVQRTAAWLASRRPPAVGPGWQASYPVWLRQWGSAQSGRNP